MLGFCGLGISSCCKMERMSLLLYLLAKARIGPDCTSDTYTFEFEVVNLPPKCIMSIRIYVSVLNVAAIVLRTTCCSKSRFYGAWAVARCRPLFGARKAPRVAIYTKHPRR